MNVNAYLLKAAVAVAVAGVASEAAAQSFSVLQQQGQEISIEADSGIEWVPGEARYTASGNVHLVRGNVELRADSVSAFYTDEAKAGATGEIDRVEAVGDVRIASRDAPAWRVSGGRATYRAETANFVVEGDGLKLEFTDAVVRAEDRLEYRERERLFVAKGNTVLASQDRRLRAEVLSAVLEQDAKGEWKVSKVNARGGVHVSTPKGIVTARKGTYTPASGTVTVTGDVKITRDGIQLNGDRAVVDLQSGVSRLFGARSRKVTGVVWPDRLSDEDRKLVKSKGSK